MVVNFGFGFLKGIGFNGLDPIGEIRRDREIRSRERKEERKEGKKERKEEREGRGGGARLGVAWPARVERPAWRGAARSWAACGGRRREMEIRR